MIHIKKTTLCLLIILVSIQPRSMIAGNDCCWKNFWAYVFSSCLFHCKSQSNGTDEELTENLHPLPSAQPSLNPAGATPNSPPISNHPSIPEINATDGRQTVSPALPSTSFQIVGTTPHASSPGSPTGSVEFVIVETNEGDPFSVKPKGW